MMKEEEDYVTNLIDPTSHPMPRVLPSVVRVRLHPQKRLSRRARWQWEVAQLRVQLSAVRASGGGK